MYRFNSQDDTPAKADINKDLVNCWYSDLMRAGRFTKDLICTSPWYLWSVRLFQVARIIFCSDGSNLNDLQHQRSQSTGNCKQLYWQDSNSAPPFIWLKSCQIGSQLVYRSNWFTFIPILICVVKSIAINVMVCILTKSWQSNL